MEEKSIANKLQELFELYKSGALTDEEYNKLKSEILGFKTTEEILHVKENENNSNSNLDNNTTIIENELSLQAKNEDIQNDSFQKKSPNLQNSTLYQNSSLNKENKSEINTITDNSQKVNSFDVTNNKRKKSSNQIILILGILCVIFAIAAIYIFLNKNEANKENPINPITTVNNSVIKSEQTIIAEHQYNLIGMYLREGESCAGLRFNNDTSATYINAFMCDPWELRLKWINENIFVLVEKEVLKKNCPPRTMLYKIISYNGDELKLKQIWTGWGNVKDEVYTFIKER